MKCLEILEREKVQDAIWERGTRFLDVARRDRRQERRAGDQERHPADAVPHLRPRRRPVQGAADGVLHAVHPPRALRAAVSPLVHLLPPHRARPEPGARGGRGEPGVRAPALPVFKSRPARGGGRWTSSSSPWPASGAETTKDAQPGLPVTAAEIGADAARCREAGAAMYHLHVRDAAAQPDAGEGGVRRGDRGDPRADGHHHPDEHRRRHGHDRRRAAAAARARTRRWRR